MNIKISLYIKLLAYVISCIGLLFGLLSRTSRPKRLLLACNCLILCFPSISAGGDPKNTPQCEMPHAYVKGELLIRVKSSTMRSAHQVKDRFGVSSIRQFRNTGTYHVKLPENLTVEEALRLYADDPDVIRVEPNYLRRVMSTDPPDDTFFENFLWGLHNTGQRLFSTPGTVGADIDALDAWEITNDCSSVVIAVIDSGIDYHHPDLKDSLWTNPGEAPNNGIDDDGNGYADDIHGWNFISADADYAGSRNIMDYNGHGTHIAGIIAAGGNNAVGVTGVCWSAQIMPLKFININGIGNVAEEIAAIEYAMDNGASIINASFSNFGDETGYSQEERDAIAAAEEAGIIFVAAAGNDGNNNDNLEEANYPASYPLDNIISVTASDQNDTLPAWSGYGPVSVDVAAPGVNIYGTVPGTDIAWETDFESNAEGWTLEGRWALTGSTSYDGGRSLTDSPGGWYTNNSNTAAVSPPIDLMNRSAPLLTCRIRGISESKYDRLYVETAADVDGPWTNEPANIILNNNTRFYENGISGSEFKDGWAHAVVPLNHLTGHSRGHFRFRLEIDDSSTADGWYIDDIQITAVNIAYPGPQAQYYGYLNGTSVAVPFVSGLAALLWSSFPEMTHRQIKDLILSGVDHKPAFTGKLNTGGRISAFNSLLIGMARSDQPREPNTETPDDFSSGSKGSGSAVLFCFITAAAE